MSCADGGWKKALGSSRLSPGDRTLARECDVLEGRLRGSFWTSPVMMLGCVWSRPTAYRLGARGGLRGGDCARKGSVGCQAGCGVHTEGGAECEGAAASAARTRALASIELTTTTPAGRRRRGRARR